MIRRLLIPVLMISLFSCVVKDERPGSACSQLSNWYTAEEKNELMFDQFITIAEKNMDCLISSKDFNPAEIPLDRMDSMMLRKLFFENGTIDSVKIFIENSRSMWGYFQGASELKSAMPEMMLHIDNQFGKPVTPFLINETLTPLTSNGQYGSLFGSLNEEILDQGDVQNTRLNDIFQKILTNNDHDDISLLISDCIFSSTNSTEMSPEMVDIQAAFLNEMRSYDLSVIVLKYTSSFDGRYYALRRNRRPNESLEEIRWINDERPYYVWIFGAKTNLDRLKSQLSFGSYSNFQGIYQLSGRQRPTYIPHQLTYTKSVGEFDIKDADHLLLDNIKPSPQEVDSKRFQFGIAVNFTSLGLPDSILLDPEQYEISSDLFELEVLPLSESIRTLDNIPEEFTHLLLLHTRGNLRSTTLEVGLKQSLLRPYWVDQSDFNPDNGGSELRGGNILKTRGFGKLMYSIERAYHQSIPGKHDGRDFHFTITTKIRN